MQIGGVGHCGPSQAMRDKLFAKADTNGDKSLSLDEFTAFTANAPKPPTLGGAGTAPSAAEQFQQFDTNGDGALTQDELDAGMDSVAKKLRDAIKQYLSGGDGTSLADLLFSNNKDATDPTSTDATSSTSASSNASSSADADITQQRQLQWILNAFVSQTNVTQQTASLAA